MPIIFMSWLDKTEKRMKKQMMIGLVMVGLVLVSFASAGLVSYLSNTVTGTINVEGPVFYLDMEETDSKSYTLKLNDPDIDTEGDFVIGEINKRLKVFISGGLGVNGEFYEHDFMVYLDAEAINYNENESGEVKVVIDIVKENGAPRNIELCDVNLPEINERGDYEVLCESDRFMSEMNPTDKLRLSLRDWSSFDVTERIHIYGDSKFQVVVKR